MAEGKSLSTKDLFLLMMGMHKLVRPRPLNPMPPEEYYLKDGELRESKWNWDWLASPAHAWQQVRYRDWLMANLVDNLVGHNQDFSAISEPMLVSLDVLTNEIKPGMSNASDAIKQIVISKNYERSFLTTLSLGLSKQQSAGQQVIVFGAGMRRRTCVWPTGDEGQTLQADVEFFVPFYVAPGEGKPTDDAYTNARSICAGIAITRPNGGSVGTDTAGHQLAAVRFNFRIPFTARKKEFEPPPIHTTVQLPPPPNDLITDFGAPVIEVQKRAMVDINAPTSAWEEFDDWEKFVEKFCERVDGRELLNAPIGPLLLETVDDSSSVKDIILNQSRRDAIKKELSEETKKDLEDTAQLLRGLWGGELPEKKPEIEKPQPSSSQRRLGHLLESLGFLSSKAAAGGEFDYTLKMQAGLTVWDIVNRMLDELDGFPLYVKGIDPKNPKGMRAALTLASQSDLNNPAKHYFGLAGLAYNIPIKPGSTDNSIQVQEEQENGGDNSNSEAGKESTRDIRLHLGKWFEGETLDDNWFRRLLPPPDSQKQPTWKRRVPLPGIRIFPFQRDATDKQKTKYSMALHGDLLSLGFDLRGTTKEGFASQQFKSGPLAYFGLGALEARIALLLSGERVAFGLGIKLKDIRLSFGPKPKKEDDKKDEGAGDSIIDGLQELLADDWAVVAESEKPEKGLNTRLGGKKKDTFSLSVGYLSPLTAGSSGTLDVQLYDDKGERGKMALISIDRRAGSVYLKHIGIGLKGVENVVLAEGKGLSKDAQLIIAFTGGMRWPVFEAGFIGAKLIIPLADASDTRFGLDGLDVSLKMESVVVSGSFLKSGVEYAGSLTIDLPKLSIGAMGIYGSLVVLSMAYSRDVANALTDGKVHADLLKELAKKEITPAAENPIRWHALNNEWELKAKDGTSYIITRGEDKLAVLGPDKTLFVYGMFSAASGSGLRVGPILFTALALGFGINRRLKVPPLEKVVDFPLVKVVMGKGGFQKDGIGGDDIRGQMGEAVEPPSEVLEKLKTWLPAERKQYFICGGVRFTIASALDCFALIAVQFGNEFELSLLGLARFRQPNDLSAKPICYVEMQVLMTLKPSEGSFKLQALLTTNSWIINEDCKLTGGFAVFVWFAGDHKDDFVITLGGYHPRFRRPDHYPLVPRLGLNWPVNDNLSIKGGVYLAVTPSCCMLGAKLEAMFSSGRVAAWFTAYLDVIVSWSPLYFDVDLGVSLRVEASFAVGTLKVVISATVKMWGPPVGGLARVNLTLLSFDIPLEVSFGKSREEAQPKLIDSWAQFCRSFLKASEADKESLSLAGGDNNRRALRLRGNAEQQAMKRPITPITQTNLTAGRSNPNHLPGAQQQTGGTPPPEAERQNAIWNVRGDQLEISASTSVPVTTLNVGRAKTNSPSAGVLPRGQTGQSMLVSQAVALDTAGLYAQSYGEKLGVHPMGRTLESVFNITVVRDDVSETVDLKGWAIEAETNSLPAALWDAEKPKPNGPSEPSAKLMRNCITGIKRLKAPPGTLGPHASLTGLSWHQLEQGPAVAKSDAAQKAPEPTGSRHVRDIVANKQDRQKQVVEALSAAGFDLAWKPTAANQVRFRELHDKPLIGAVAASA